MQEDKKSKTYYLNNFRSYVEQAYFEKKKDEKPANWSPFVSKTSFSLERKVEFMLKEEMNKSMTIQEKNSEFFSKLPQVFSFILKNKVF